LGSTSVKVVHITLMKLSPAAYLGDRFWLPFIQPNPMEIMNWVHVETGQAGNLTWRRGQVNLYLITTFIKWAYKK
jgi:hypothetical protein